MYPDRYYKLDLRRWDEREMAKILIIFAVEEPGENWIAETFRWTKYETPVPGWQLPQSWTLHLDDDTYDQGLERHGWLTVTYTSYGKDCVPNASSRRGLRKRTLVGMKRVI